jgi:peroxiredoxin
MSAKKTQSQWLILLHFFTLVTAKKIPPMIRFTFSAFIVVATISIQSVAAQTADEVLKKYEQAKRNIQTMSYRIQRIDTFPGGSVWNNRGYCIMKRNEKDSLIGFLFKAKRDDVDSEIVFNGSDYYMINHKNKTFKISREVHRGILGSPGGQMVFTPVINMTENFKKVSLTRTDSCFILRFDFPDNKEYQIENRYEEIYLNPETYLPFYSYQSAERAETRSVTASKLSDLQVNTINFNDPFENKDYLSDYTIEKPSPEEEQPSAKLINQPAPDFELTDINGNKFKLSQHRKKVIVLDFWELWCSPCIKSLPKLNEMAKKFPSDKVEIWSIVSDSKSFDKVKAFVNRQEFSYPVMFGNEETSKNYIVEGVPLYVLIDKQGIIRFMRYGFDDELENTIKKYL